MATIADFFINFLKRPKFTFHPVSILKLTMSTFKNLHLLHGETHAGGSGRGNTNEIFILDMYLGLGINIELKNKNPGSQIRGKSR